ncbi:hypothetical protein BA195_10205 [Tenacibaculum soleae]|uniref:Uncharacterized protein n=1 Tax=Tenacibaculum soleae TaxID=447689 RepID=A0A1B9XYC9_9FLAO|nr:hypothetical protein [Tenacibaculum soleae]OCK42539.1 hypothetical protein BA195_10205 [Tenacibaculum soleae]
MAITIQKEPLGIYPAYNDSFVQFTSSLTGTTEAIIEIEGINTKPFLIYPNLNGRFIFNLKELVKSRFNTNGFNDPFTSYPSEWGESVEGSYLTQSINITDYGVGVTGTTISRNYEFFKSVKQIDEVVYNNNCQILNHSENGVDYNLTYFEGFPFSVDLQRINKYNTVKIKNLNNEFLSNALSSLSTDSFRLYIDKGTSNWSTSNFLPLSDNLNRLEIYENNTFKTNLNLKKVPAKCGVYIKWFNNDGGYSYWLFDEFYKTTTKAKKLKSVNTNSFNNVNDGLVAPTTLIGKEVGETIKVKSTIDKNEAELLSSLIASPSVQMYTSQRPYINGKWVNVTINDTYTISNKRALNQAKFTIELPNKITARL